MKSAAFVKVFLPALIAFAAAVFVLNYYYDNNEFFRNIFAQQPAASMEVGSAAAAVAAAQQQSDMLVLSGRISMFSCAFITFLQILAFLAAAYVRHGILKDSCSPAAKLKKLENADIFFDLPLYLGLFGSVTAFLLINFCPQSSKIIAYSSTMIGIIFSVVLRLALLYPARRNLLQAKGE
ncbi:MAG: hypothetical protein PHS41_00910 [Victivallaceae bacterium]|nr:hypothetical protein [Victivallaceae bacterium]